MSFNTDAIVADRVCPAEGLYLLGLTSQAVRFLTAWLARVSYGRTFREIAIVRRIWTTPACWLAFAILGNYGMHQN